MFELIAYALTASFLTDATKLAIPVPVPPALKTFFVVGWVGIVGLVVELSWSESVVVLGLTHLVHNAVKLLSATGDLARVKALLSLPNNTRRMR